MSDEKSGEVIITDRALDVDLMALTVMHDLRDRLKGITADQIAASERRFLPVPKKSARVGQITDVNTKAMHALWMSLDGSADLEAAEARLAVLGEIETDHKERHALMESLAGVAREIWWAQVKRDLDIYRCISMGVFKDWTIVENKDRSGGMSGFVQMLGGLPFPGGSGSEEE